MTEVRSRPPAPEQAPSAARSLQGPPPAVQDGWVRRAGRAVRRAWRRSLQLRIVSATALLGLLVVSGVGTYLYQEISSGLTNDRVRASQYDAANLTRTVQGLFDTTKATTVEGLNLAAADVVERYVVSGQQDSRYAIFVRSLTNTRPVVLGTVESGPVPVAAITADQRRAVAANPGQQQTQVLTLPIGGVSTRAVVVGSVLDVPVAGPYDLYLIYPMDREAQTMGLIGRSFAVAGLILSLLVGAIAWVVTQQAVAPVRSAAGIAQRFASGRLDERMVIDGEDDIALLGTSFNSMADNIETHIRQLEGLSRLQQRFVSDVSHELRTPLTTVRMAADLLHDSRDDFDPVVARSVELLHGELGRFENLLADLLEISRFDAGAAALESEPVDLRRTLREVLQDAGPLAERRGSALEVVGAGEPLVAEVDERRVARILRNLVVNAIEHGEGGPVRCHLGRSDDAVAIVVEDHGVGLRPGEAALVFNRFWRADPARARTTGGTGLGLAIALEDAHLHGGWLQAWGAPGQGSRFRLTLPRHAGAELTSSPLPLEPS